MLKIALSLLVLAMLSAAPAAHATERTDAGGLPPATHEPVAAPVGESYWYQTALADAVGFTGMVVLYNRRTSSTLLTVAPYLLASPTVHLLHRRPATALVSFLLNVGAPVVGAMIGLGLDSGGGCGSGEDCAVPFGGLLVGAAAGFLAAIVVDSAALAREAPVRRPSQLSLAPTVQIARSGTTLLGFAATF
jgi:hypothetical protein